MGDVKKGRVYQIAPGGKVRVAGLPEGSPASPLLETGGGASPQLGETVLYAQFPDGSGYVIPKSAASGDGGGSVDALTNMEIEQLLS
jgi:hypothetical protein